MTQAAQGIAADFHTHSIASPDGGLTLKQYQRMLVSGRLQAVAITDHNTIDFAVQARTVLGDAIIVGEEITTQAGEIIGLFLTEPVPPLLSLSDTIQRIKKQGGLVYVPHPLETVRKGLRAADVAAIAGSIDIIEVLNGRAIFQDRSRQALAMAQQYDLAGAASSDAHGWAGWGTTHTILAAMPTAVTLVGLLKTAQYQRKFPGVRALLYPKQNRLKKWRAHV